LKPHFKRKKTTDTPQVARSHRLSLSQAKATP
jgi:hypothetical protein